MRHLSVSIDIDAPASVVWDLLAEFDLWPVWGPSIRRVDSATDRAAAGATGRVQTIAGLWLPFEITGVREGETWFWKVAGIPATRHYLSSIDPDGSRVRFTVPWVLAPYMVVLRIALVRIKRMAEQG